MTGSVVNESSLTSSTAGIVAYNRGTISQCANYANIVGTTAGGIAETVSSTGGIRANPSSTPSDCYYDVTEDDYGTTSTAV